MNTTYLEKLEYNKILEKLAYFCITFVGKEHALNLVPSNKKEIVQNLLAETNEALSLVEKLCSPTFFEIEDICLYIKILENSSSLTAKALLDIANILENAKQLKLYFSQLDNTETYMLNNYFSCLYTNDSILQNLRKSILDENTISDNASPKLADIRRKKVKLEQSIKNSLNTVIHSSRYSKYIQENVITIRNDRYVIPIKQEYRVEIKGFVHDFSSSGSTVFIEPLSVFELNNELNNLKNEENLEIEKILYNLSSILFCLTKELETNVNTIGKLDFIFAKAKYAKSINAICPNINNTKSINLINAVHPLLDVKKAVPISINIGDQYSLLIITGPNTGGKTVTLKTVGLLELMACSRNAYSCK